MMHSSGNYYDALFDLARSIRVADNTGNEMNFADGIKATCEVIIAQSKTGKKLIFIGNGGSAAISSHMAIDFWKNACVKAMSFNDGPQLTCLGNDFGYDYVFEKPIEVFAEAGDVLVAISSSGKSENILKAVKSARKKGCKVITLTGFDIKNPLSTMGDINYYVPSLKYGPVEVLHHSICHCIIDNVIGLKNGQIQN